MQSRREAGSRGAGVRVEAARVPGVGPAPLLALCGLGAGGLRSSSAGGVEVTGVRPTCPVGVAHRECSPRVSS